MQHHGCGKGEQKQDDTGNSVIHEVSFRTSSHERWWNVVEVNTANAEQRQAQLFWRTPPQSRKLDGRYDFTSRV
jgi:hypothetical protein